MKINIPSVSDLQKMLANGRQSGVKIKKDVLGLQDCRHKVISRTCSKCSLKVSV